MSTLTERHDAQHECRWHGGSAELRAAVISVREAQR